MQHVTWIKPYNAQHTRTNNNMYALWHLDQRTGNLSNWDPSASVKGQCQVESTVRQTRITVLWFSEKTICCHYIPDSSACQTSNECCSASWVLLSILPILFTELCWILLLGCFKQGFSICNSARLLFVRSVGTEILSLENIVCSTADMMHASSRKRLGMWCMQLFLQVLNLNRVMHVREGMLGRW